MGGGIVEGFAFYITFRFIIKNCARYERHFCIPPAPDLPLPTSKTFASTGISPQRLPCTPRKLSNNFSTLADPPSRIAVHHPCFLLDTLGSPCPPDAFLAKPGAQPVPRLQQRVLGLTSAQRGVARRAGGRIARDRRQAPPLLAPHGGDERRFARVLRRYWGRRRGAASDYAEERGRDAYGESVRVIVVAHFGGWGRRRTVGWREEW